MDKFKNINHITILGNGKSLNKLSKKELNLINSTKIFRCNWFFLDNSNINKNILGWFHNIPGGFDEILNKFNNSDRSTNYILAPFITDDHRKKINTKQFQFLPSWDISKKQSVVAQKHLLSKKERGDLNLPTTGITMFHFTCLMNPNKITICGMDMYKQESKENSDFSKHKYDNPYNMECKPHSMKTEILFMIDACFHLKSRDKLNILHCPYFEKIIDLIFQEVTPKEMSTFQNDYDFMNTLSDLIYLKL